MSGMRKPALLAGAAILAVAAVTIAGTPAGIGRAEARLASASSSGPIEWMPPWRQAPDTGTSLAPGLTVLNLPGHSSGPALFWAGPSQGHSGDEVSYEVAQNVRGNRWWPPGTVGMRDKGGFEALTGQRPSAAPFGGASSDQVIVTWEGAADQKVWYAVGDVGAKGVITWPHGASAIPGAFTSAGPTVFSLAHAGTVFVTWKAGRSDRLNYVEGRVKGSTVSWAKISRVPAAQSTGAVAIAEISTGPKAGRLYAFWRDPAGQLAGAWTADPPPVGPAPWKLIRSSLPASTGPAATAIEPDDGFPVLVAYRGSGERLLYAQLSKTGQLTHDKSWMIPALSGRTAPALISGLIAATDPDVDTMTYYVRACPACRLGDGG